MEFLLDTCTLLWLAADQSHLSQRCREALEKASGKLYISAISAFEIGQKVARKKLELPMATSLWFPQVTLHHGLIEIPLSATTAAQASELPLLHNDPFDRIIIATAFASKLTILTPDHLIAQYPDVNVVW